MSFEVSQVVITIVVVCLFLWRISYGANNGLFAEAAGCIAVIAAFAGVYYIMKIAGSILSSRFGDIIPKIGFLAVALIIYGLMSSLAKTLKLVKEIPILGGFDRFLGAVLGAVEAGIVIYTVVYITGFDLIGPVVQLGMQCYSGVLELF